MLNIGHEVAYRNLFLLLAVMLLILAAVGFWVVLGDSGAGQLPDF